MLDQAVVIQRESRLLMEMEALQTKLRRICGRCSRDPGTQGDDADQAAHVVDLATDLALRERWEQKLDELRKARSRLRAGQYGVCESCGASIDPERLDVMPQVVRCIVCQRESRRQGCRTNR